MGDYNIQIVLPHLEPWQMDVYKAITEPKAEEFPVYVVKARRQVGKSILAEVLLITFSLQAKGRRTSRAQKTSVIVEPTLNQSRRVYKQILTMLEGSNIIRSANGTLLSIEFINGSEILFKSAEQKEALRGLTISGLLVIDEAAFIEDEIFEILSPTVDVYNAPTLVISTPLFQDGKFWEMYTSPMYQTFDWSTYDTSKYLSQEKLDQYRKEMSPTKFKSEYLGEFVTEGSYVFTNIARCIRNNLSGTAKYCGIDWAVGNSGDFTVVTFLSDTGDVVDLQAFNNLEPSTQIEVIAGLINSKPSLEKVQVELNSIGSVYYDYLRKAMNRPAILQGFNTTNDSKRRIIEQLVSAFQKETIGIPENPELIKELNHYSVEKTAKGYTYNGIGAHDDAVISLALAYDLISNTGGNYVLSMNRKAGRKPSLAEKYR